MDNGRPLRGRAAFWRAGLAPVRLVAVAFGPDLAGDGELGGILAILAEQVGEEAAACVDEPVTYLERIKRNG